MLTFSSEASSERRRRQNRESQQRRRQRQKQSDPNDHHGANAPDDRRVNNFPLISPPLSSHHPDSSLLEPQAFNSYFVQNHSLPQYQPRSHDAFQPSSTWPMGDSDFSVGGNDRCRPASSKNDRSLEDGPGDYPQPRAKDDTLPSPFHLEEQHFAHLPPRSGANNHHTRHHCSNPSQIQHEQPTPAPSHIGGGTSKQATSHGEDPRTRDTEATSVAEKTIKAEKAIKKVQMLYSLGVKVGFLKKDDRVRDYLATMKRKYQKIPSLRDEDRGDSSYSDLDIDDEWDSESNES